MTQCREAIVEQNWVELVSAVHNIAAKARRVSEVAKTRLDSIKDHQQRRTVKEALTKLEASEYNELNFLSACLFVCLSHLSSLSLYS